MPFSLDNTNPVPASTMATLQSLSAELKIEIFVHLDPRSTRALAYTCKPFLDTFLRNQKTIAQRKTANLLLRWFNHTSLDTVKLAFMAAEARRIQNRCDINGLLHFHQGFAGTGDNEKDYTALMVDFPVQFSVIRWSVIPFITTIPIGEVKVQLSPQETGRMLRGIFAIEALYNLTCCAQQGQPHLLNSSVRVAVEFWVKFSRHEVKQMRGILDGIFSVRFAPGLGILHPHSLNCIRPDMPLGLLKLLRMAMKTAHHETSLFQPRREFPPFAPGVPRAAHAGQSVESFIKSIRDRFSPFTWIEYGSHANLYVMDEEHYSMLLEKEPAWQAYLAPDKSLVIQYTNINHPPPGGFERFHINLAMNEARLKKVLGLDEDEG